MKRMQTLMPFNNLGLIADHRTVKCDVIHSSEVSGVHLSDICGPFDSDMSGVSIISSFIREDTLVESAVKNGRNSYIQITNDCIPVDNVFVPLLDNYK